MKGRDLVRVIGEIAENRKIPKDVLFIGVEEAMCQILREEEGKPSDHFSVTIGRKKGEVDAKQNKTLLDNKTVEKYLECAMHQAELQVIGREMLKLANVIHEVRKIPYEDVIEGIEEALRLAIFKHYGAKEDAEINLHIDRITGLIEAQYGDEMITPDVLGRISAQSAKQLLIQKLREAESQAVFDDFAAQKGEMVRGVIQRYEHGTAIVGLDHSRSEAILPRGEQIPGETLHAGDRIESVILEVRKNGHRVKIVLSRTHPEYVRQLFEREIPEIQEKIIEVRAVSREAGYRTKVAVSSIDMKVDCVGACVGVRGSRIKNIVDALGGSERIDIVRWNDSLQVLIPNALQPAEIEEVFLYPRLGRAIVLVQDDQLSLAIGRRGQNVRLASKLVGWDIEIMTHDELNEGIDRAEQWFMQIPGVEAEMVEVFIEEGFLSYDDLTFVETFELAELIGVTEEVAAEMIAVAEEAAENVEEVPRIRVDEDTASRTSQDSQAGKQKAGLDRIFGNAEGSSAGDSSGKTAFDNLFREEEQASEVVEERPDGELVEEESDEEEILETKEELTDNNEDTESDEDEEDDEELENHEVAPSVVDEHGIEDEDERPESPVEHRETSKIDEESDEEAKGMSPGEEAYIESIADGEPGSLEEQEIASQVSREDDD